LRGSLGIGQLAPRESSGQTIAFLNKHLVAALRSPELMSDVRKQGAEPAVSTLE
jgi:hypothetical protein